MYLKNKYLIFILLFLFPLTVNAVIMPKETVEPKKILFNKPGKTEFELVESVPENIPLDNPDIRNTKEVLLEVINNAETTLDIGEFYVSSEKGKSLEYILESIKDAAKNGVKVRIITDTLLLGGIKDLKDLNKYPNITVGLIDLHKITGGIMHAKYLIADKKVCFIGSQNFDWKSLDQIFELGVLVKNREFAERVSDVFETDWQICVTDTYTVEKKPPVKNLTEIILESGQDTVSVLPVSTPPDITPGSVGDEEKEILKLINNAKKDIFIQVMKYSPYDKYGNYYSGDIDNALRAAAGRGVQVKLLVTDWCFTKPIINYLKSLTFIPNIEVKSVIFPRLENEFLSFARVSHSKYMVIDRDKGWVGSSNWEPGYFKSTRNVGVVIKGNSTIKKLRKIFINYWTSKYSEFIDTCKNYRYPQLGD